MTGSDLLERGDQQLEIGSAVRAARDGAGSLLLIEGSAGLGKSRLLEEVVRVSGQQRVLRARASELEQSFGFGVVRQLFERVVRDPELGPAVLAGGGASAADVFSDSPVDEQQATFALLHGLHWLTLNLAELQPLVLAIDDLHWCDPASLRFIAYLSRRIADAPVLLAATTRPPEATGRDTQALEELLAEPSGVHLSPAPLSQSGAAALLSAQLDQPIDTGFARACYEATDGNPLMLRQLARSIDAEQIEPSNANAGAVGRAAHRALSRTVLARLGRHSADAVSLARAVAVLGDTGSPALLAALAGRAEAAIAPAWQELVEAEILERRRLTFVHALVRDAVYFDIPAPERADLHLRAAHLLHDSDAPVERVAGQLERVPPRGDPWIVDRLVEAADRGRGHHALDAVAAYLGRALQEPPPPERVTELMVAQARALFAGDLTSAVELTRPVLRRELDPLTRAELQMLQMQSLVLTDQPDEASLICREALAAGGGDKDMLAVFETGRIVAALFGVDDPGALEGLEQLRTPIERPTPGIARRAGIAALLWSFDGGSAREVGELALTAVTDDIDDFIRHVLVSVAPLQLLATTEHPMGPEIHTRVLADIRRTGADIEHVKVWIGTGHFHRGDLASAILAGDEALESTRARRLGLEAERYNTATIALACTEQGDLTRARALLDGGRPADDADTLGALMWRRAEAAQLLAEGRAEDALAVTVAAERHATWAPTPNVFDWRPNRARALRLLGRTEEALATADEALMLARAWGGPWLLGQVLRTRGEILGGDGLDDLRESVAVLQDSPARLELAKSLVALGAALRRGRQPAEARVPLEHGLALARACDAAVLAEQARLELASSGVRRQATLADGPGSLTPSERRVADLAAAGHTNREIAQELYVTPKTVEVHLSASYRKLGIRSRQQLVGALAEA